MNDLGQALALGVAIILLALPAWWMIMGMEALVPGMRRQAVVRSLLVTMRVPYFALGILGFGAGLVTGFWPLALLGVAFVLHPVVVWRRNTGSDVQSWRSSYAPPPPIQRAAQPTPPDAGRTRLDPRVAARYFRRSAAAHAVDLILAALLWLAIATISEGSVQAGSVFTLAWWCAANAGSAVALFLGYPRLCRLVGSRTLGRRLLRL